MDSFKALWVTEGAHGAFQQDVIQRSIADLPSGDILIKVSYSSLNYKDALSAIGNRGVTRRYPHTPGIDAAGVVVESRVADFKPGDEVVVTGYDLGMDTPGGFGQYIRVPAGWVIKRPGGLSLRETMILGTAGLTAGLCVEKLEKSGLTASAGSVLVTGASGGVGTLAIKLLTRLGYSVAAASAKIDHAEFLNRLGARQILDRATMMDGIEKPLLKEQWAGAIDTVGGDILFNVVKSLHYGASVVCCGLTAGSSFKATVFPFILRGVNLLGVDSVELPLHIKAAMWERLATQWKLDDLDDITREVHLDDLPNAINQMLAGKMIGRILVRLD
ncbi:putative YhdH/YhfP family quinone oxidoreductase [Pseudomonas duriflava]|uniref:Putative YhdH/YhfP family quinone oxidoreductase n=1 Tax=Pseudomonas duriflava TaxID=459528 RepID=A0A562Q904_9PSED|nr:YhdH/YhfP family quinone oxidoreductase [Pseudomonas duriflava]TWI53174.1 putative YhdH/YhfP family quinone oxidoreductase [Pseudomonas duriflava]